MKRTNKNPNAISKDKNYYLQNIDIEKALLEKATQIAERMIAAFIREQQQIQLKAEQNNIDLDLLAEKIASKIEVTGILVENKPESNKASGFSLDNSSGIVESIPQEKIKGGNNLIKKTSGDSIKESLDALSGFEL